MRPREFAGDQVQDIAKHSLFAEVGWRPVDALRTAINVRYTGKRTGGNIFVPGFCNRFFCFDEAGNGVNALQFLESQKLGDHWVVTSLPSYGLIASRWAESIVLQLNIDNLLDEKFIGAVTGATSTLPEFGVIGGLTAESALDPLFHRLSQDRDVYRSRHILKPYCPTCGGTRAR